MTPLVSICMPHLNSGRFTRERVESILRQTLPDWELVIIDSQSDDGSRQILESYAADDARIRLVQGPRDGIYTNLNRAIELASGKYIYIATSDDTMVPECLEQMVRALEENPDCGLCHCSLQIIDDQGRPVSEAEDWRTWSRQTECFGPWLDVPHVRRAPHDGILHLGLGTVYASLTQLLVRRRVFEELGFFRTDCSAHADFEWGMRVGLNENVVHLPNRLATWRRHAAQATQQEKQSQIRVSGEFHRLAGSALAAHQPRNPELVKALRKGVLRRFYLVDEVNIRRLSSASKLQLILRMAVFVVKHPIFSLQWLYCKVVRRKKMMAEFGQVLRSEFARLGCPDLLEELSDRRGPAAQTTDGAVAFPARTEPNARK